MTTHARLMKVGSIALTLALLIAWQGLARARTDSDQKSDDRHPTYTCSVKVPNAEPKDLSSLAKIRADAAIGAALNAYPGAVVTNLKLENENGCLVYGVHLNNGREVLVDAGKGTVIHSQATGSHEEQSEHEETGENED